MRKRRQKNSPVLVPVRVDVRERDVMAALPAHELSGSGEEVAVVPHQVVRHDHRVDIIARHLEGGGRRRPLNPHVCVRIVKQLLPLKFPSEFNPWYGLTRHRHT